MRAMICVDPPDWEKVVRGASKYLSEAAGVVLACASDERASEGYELSVRGLLGRRSRPETIRPTSAEAAAKLLEEASALLARLRPGLQTEVLSLHGRPPEELAKAALEGGFDVVFVGRGDRSQPVRERVSGLLTGWKTNPHGEADGLFLRSEEGALEVRFPPHKGEEMKRTFREGSTVEVWGMRRGHHLHAFGVADPDGGRSVEAHRPPGREKGPEKVHLGHTARFVLDHVPCDVVVLA